MALTGNESLKKNAQEIRDPDGRLVVVNAGAPGGAGSPVDTELPAAAALADAMANPTAPEVAAALQAFNGATWDRIRDVLASDLSAGAGVLAAALVIKNSGTPIYAPITAPNLNADGGSLNTGLPVADYRWNGASWDRLRCATIFKTVDAVAITAGTGATVWTPAGGKKFRVLGWALALSVAGKFIFGDNAVGTVLLKSEKVAAAGISQAPSHLDNGLLSAAANNVLKLDVSASGTVDGFVFGTEE